MTTFLRYRADVWVEVDLDELDVVAVVVDQATLIDPVEVVDANRSTVGMLNEFGFLADVRRTHGDADDLVALSVRLAGTPCGPLYKSHSFPDRELAAVVAERFGT